MKTENIKNKKGEQLTTKEGENLVKNTFEPGDEFIPKSNTVYENIRDVTDKNGNNIRIVNNKIICSVKTSKSVSQDIWVDLTPAQAQSIRKKVQEGIQINQHVWKAYEYDSEKYGKHVGIGIKKDFKPAITFEDAEKQEKEM